MIPKTIRYCRLVGESCRKGYLGTDGKTGQDTFNLSLGEFGKIGDSEEELADPVQQGEAIVSNLFILDHDHDLIEECIDGLSHLGHLKDCRFVGPLL